MITNRYSKLAWAIPTFKTTASPVADMFMDYLLITYIIETYLLTSNGIQFVSTFFAAVCAILRTKLLTIAA